MTSPRITAPFSEAQVRGLNRWQRAGHVHPFTCGKRDEHRGHEGVLQATASGWACTAPGCDYVQTWAHAFMADGPPPFLRIVKG